MGLLPGNTVPVLSSEQQGRACGVSCSRRLDISAAVAWAKLLQFLCEGMDA